METFEGMELQCANELLMEHRIPFGFGLQAIVAQCLVYECDRLGSPDAAMDHMRQAMTEAQRAGEVINRFWFDNQKYLPTLTDRFQPGYVPQATPTEEEAYRMWQSCNEAYRKLHPWKGKVYA